MGSSASGLKALLLPNNDKRDHLQVVSTPLMALGAKEWSTWHVPGWGHQVPGAPVRRRMVKMSLSKCSWNLCFRSVLSRR